MKQFTLDKCELEELCAWPANPQRYTDFAEMSYSQGYWLKKFLFYPHFFDLYITLQHGVYFNYFIEQYDEIYQDTDIFFSYTNKKYLSRYKQNIPIGSPYLWYKSFYNIKKKQGLYTLVFPSHSLSNREFIDFDNNLDNYIYDLKKLSQEYHPLLICLYFRDVQKGYHHKFYEAGFDVTSVGHGSRYDFIPRFYELLSNAKYTMSNHIGSMTVYSIDIDIPFIIYGKDFNFIQKEKGYETIKIDKDAIIKNTNYTLFRNTDIITPEQRTFLEQYYSKIPISLNKRIYLSYILYSQWFKFQIKFLKRKLFRFYLEYIFEPKKRLNLGNIDNYKKRYVEYLYRQYNDICMVQKIDYKIKEYYNLVYFNLDLKDDEIVLLIDKIFNNLENGGVFVCNDLKKQVIVKKYLISKYKKYFQVLLGFEDMFVVKKVSDVS